MWKPVGLCYKIGLEELQKLLPVGHKFMISYRGLEDVIYTVKDYVVQGDTAKIITDDDIIYHPYWISKVESSCQELV